MLGIKTPFQKTQLNQKNVPKQNHNRSYEETINFDSYFQEIGGGELTTTNKKSSKPLNTQITSNRNLHTPVNKTRNLNFTSVINTNNLNLPNQNINFNTCQSSIRKENKSSNPGNSKDIKEKISGNSSDKSKLLTNTTNKAQNKKFHYNNSRTENTKKPNNPEIKKSKLNNNAPEIVKKLEPNFNKIKKKENIESTNNNTSINEDNNNLLNANSMKKTISTQNQNTIASPTIYNENINNESNSLLHTSISQELISLNFVNESNNLLDDNNMDLDSLDAFTQTKNDFNLLYTNEYIKMIQDDLLKLELELLIEKMFEIVSCYHTQLSNEKVIYGKVSKLYKECSQKFLLLNKQYSKLQHQKEKFQISKQNLHFISGNNIKNSQNLLSVNKEEINMFNILVKPKKNDTFLKEILSIIVAKNKHFILENCNEKEIEFLQKGSYLKNKKKEKSSIEVPPLKGIEYLNERPSLAADSANGSKTGREKDRQTFLKRLTVPKTINGKKKK